MNLKRNGSECWEALNGHEEIKNETFWGNEMNQPIIPASSNMKEFEAFLKSDYEIGVFLEVHVSQLKHISLLAKKQIRK